MTHRLISIFSFLQSTLLFESFIKHVWTILTLLQFFGTHIPSPYKPNFLSFYPFLNSSSGSICDAQIFLDVWSSTGTMVDSSRALCLKKTLSLFQQLMIGRNVTEKGKIQCLLLSPCWNFVWLELAYILCMLS